MTHPDPTDYSYPYTLTIKAASQHFGFAKGTLYNWINDGRLRRGVHYLKVGKKPMIVRKKFIEWMEEEDGSRKAR